jgi:hypothetical protein
MTNTKLEMLSAREQLMEDIDCIIDGFFYDTWGEEYYTQDREELVKVLCDAVWKNLPFLIMINTRKEFHFTNQQIDALLAKH